MVLAGVLVSTHLVVLRAHLYGDSTAEDQDDGGNGGNGGVCQIQIYHATVKFDKVDLRSLGI